MSLVDGNWGEWIFSTMCSSTCGKGVRNRTRLCDNPSPLHNGKACEGADQESVDCPSLPPCPGMNIFLINAKFNKIIT